MGHQRGNTNNNRIQSLGETVLGIRGREGERESAGKKETINHRLLTYKSQHITNRHCMKQHSLPIDFYGHWKQQKDQKLVAIHLMKSYFIPVSFSVRFCCCSFFRCCVLRILIRITTFQPKTYQMEWNLRELHLWNGFFNESILRKPMKNLGSKFLGCRYDLILKIVHSHWIKYALFERYERLSELKPTPISSARCVAIGKIKYFDHNRREKYCNIINW